MSYAGKGFPKDYTNTFRKGLNFGDVPDPVEARQNLDVPSNSEALMPDGRNPLRGKLVGDGSGTDRIAPELLRGRTNYIINGGFEEKLWQRGTSQTSSGYGSDDRWANVHSGSTKTHSRAGSRAQYYSRTNVSSVAGAGNYVAKQQRIENVAVLAGKTVTLAFDAKADAARDIAVDFTQYFGSGGSSTVSALGVQKFSLTTGWSRHYVTVALPDVSSKTIGSGSFTEVTFWFDAGSDRNNRTNSLGQQSGIFDLANITLVEGPDPVEYHQVSRPIGEELALCQRYYLSLVGTIYTFSIGNSSSRRANIIHPVTMRTVPAVTATASAGTLTFSGGATQTAVSQGVGDQTTVCYISNFTADAEL